MLVLKLADSNNDQETYNPLIYLSQDVVGERRKIGLSSSSGVDFTDSMQNSLYMDTSGQDEIEGIQLQQNGIARMTISRNGNIGIGTNNPTTPLYVSKNTTNNLSWTQWLSSGGIVTSLSGSYPLSAYFSNSIAAPAFHTFSDNRVKTEISLVNDETALNQVNTLESYEYHYIDPECRDDLQKQLRFIAQGS